MDRCGKPQRELAEFFQVCASIAQRLRGCEDPRVGWHGREAGAPKREPCDARHCGNDRLENLRREVKSEAPIAPGVLMAAFEAGAGVAEQQ